MEWGFSKYEALNHLQKVQSWLYQTLTRGPSVMDELLHVLVTSLTKNKTFSQIYGMLYKDLCYSSELLEPSAEADSDSVSDLVFNLRCIASCENWYPKPFIFYWFIYRGFLYVNVNGSENFVGSKYNRRVKILMSGLSCSDLFCVLLLPPFKRKLQRAPPNPSQFQVKPLNQCWILKIPLEAHLWQKEWKMQRGKKDKPV